MTWAIASWFRKLKSGRYDCCCSYWSCHRPACIRSSFNIYVQSRCQETYINCITNDYITSSSRYYHDPNSSYQSSNGSSTVSRLLNYGLPWTPDRPCQSVTTKSSNLLLQLTFSVQNVDTGGSPSHYECRFIELAIRSLILCQFFGDAAHCNTIGKFLLDYWAN